MAYRRPKDDGVFSSRWRIAHRADLADCGIPPQVAADDRRWLYVLHHGDDELETGWSVSWLSDEQVTKLLALLEPHVPNAIAVDLVQDLRRRRDATGSDRQRSPREQ